MHCPQCGRATPQGAAACPSCGAALPAPAAAPAPAGAPKPAARTMIGVAASDLLPQPGAAAAPKPVARTIVGMPASDLGMPPPGGAEQERDPRLFAGTLVVGTPAAMAGAPLQRPSGTIVGQPTPLGPDGTVVMGTAAAVAARQAPEPASRTLLGVARPGIAPLAPGAEPDPDPEPADETPGYPTAGGELGATIGPHGNAWAAALRDVRPPDVRPRRRERERLRPEPAAAQPRPKATSWRALAVIGAGGVLAVGAVLFALLWPSAPPVSARARADASGNEVIELRCASCPNGTTLAIGEGRAAVTGGVAQVPLAAPLSVGENQVKVVIDRPGSGRDETVAVPIHVAYRIRPDLGTLQGERPTIQIVVDAAAGTEVTLDGKPVALAAGRAIEGIDVSDAIRGPADDARTLSRQIPYTVKPPDGPKEQGVVSVAIGIVPLRIDAPGPSVVIDKESFVLEGHTAKGAQLFAGPHPIPVRPDGTFAHVMNVSAVGATQFEVRAKMQGMAPRIVKIGVRRVDRLESAAKEFTAQGPIGWAEIAADPKAHAGKPIVLAGEIVEARTQGHSTVMLLAVSPASGCKERDPGACKVRLVHGVANPAQRGDVITAYGRVSAPFAPPGGAPVPEVQVEFTLGAPGRGK